MVLERGLFGLAQGVAILSDLAASPPQALDREHRGQAQPAEVLPWIHRAERACVGNPTLAYRRLRDYRAAFPQSLHVRAPLAEAILASGCIHRPFPLHVGPVVVRIVVNLVSRLRGRM